MKIDFLNSYRPTVTVMIQSKTASNAINTIRNAAYEGADAFGLQICRLAPEEREHLKEIYAASAGRPFYITNYRYGYNEGMSDEECMQGLLDGLKLGGNLGDIMGDTFGRAADEITRDIPAIDKQRKLIDEIHSMGKSVLMSSHLYRYAGADEVLEIAYEHQRRGADISKIVTAANSEAEEAENIRITSLLKKELKIPFLFLSGGTHYKIHRLVSPMLGSCMSLCVQQYDELATKAQPPLKFVRFVNDNMDYTADR